MGQNLILNMNDHGNVVCAYNRTPDKVTKFLENEAKNTNVSPYRMIYLLLTKGGLISESFLLLFLAHFDGKNLSQIEKLSEIKPPLVCNK